MLVHPHVVDLAAGAYLLDPESQHPQAVLLEQPRSDLQVLMECGHIARRGFIGTELVNHLDTSSMRFVILARRGVTPPCLYPYPHRPFPDAPRLGEWPAPRGPVQQPSLEKVGLVYSL